MIVSAMTHSFQRTSFEIRASPGRRNAAGRVGSSDRQQCSGHVLYRRNRVDPTPGFRDAGNTGHEFRLRLTGWISIRRHGGWRGKRISG